jgi:hypothetical protein
LLKASLIVLFLLNFNTDFIPKGDAKCNIIKSFWQS